MKLSERCAALIFLISHLSPAVSVPACPQSHREVQPDGSSTPPLYLQGDHTLNYVTDAEGYAVVRDESTGWHVYAEERQQPQDLLAGGEDEHDDDHHVKPGQRRVGSIDPAKYNVPRILNSINAARSQDNQRRRRTSQTQDAHEETSKIFTDGPPTNTFAAPPQQQFAPPTQQQQMANPPPSTGTLHNLVLLLRFADHTNRILPSQQGVEILYNKLNGDPLLAPTGSVRDAFIENSYGQLDIQTTVIDWITLSEPEEYYANGNHGLTKLVEGIQEALDVLEADSTFAFADYDNNGSNGGGDGILDSFGVLTSSYGAEYGGSDCYGQYNTNRIWSHYGLLSWESYSEDIAVNQFHVSSAFRGSCGSNLVRRGVLVHELGHVLGLPDLYDPTFAGWGIGSYDVMSNAWGFDGTGLYPPAMSAWTKVELGWVTPTVLSSDGQYSIGESGESSKVYKIDSSFPDGEYLLIENRQPTGLDAKLPHGGLAIWHIDELASSQRRRGFPDQDGWPTNSHHYKVALLQADGRYDLEMNENSGDEGDLWHAASVGSSANALLGPGMGGTVYPNTDSYQLGIIQETGVSITDMSGSQGVMSFLVSGLSSSGSVTSDQPTNNNNPTRRPTMRPTNKPTVSPTTKHPTNAPTKIPTASPTKHPTRVPTSRSPTKKPSASPIRAAQPLSISSEQGATPTRAPMSVASSDVVPCPAGYVGSKMLPGCIGFYFCVHGNQVGADTICAPGTLFDADKGYCDYDHKVECDEFSGESHSQSPHLIPTGESSIAAAGNNLFTAPSDNPTHGPSRRPTPAPTRVRTYFPTDATKKPTRAPSVSPTNKESDAAVIGAPTNNPSTTKSEMPSWHGDCPEKYTGHVALEGCRGFYYCSNGTKRGNDIPCASGTLFDVIRGYCAWEDTVVCTSRTVGLSTTALSPGVNGYLAASSESPSTVSPTPAPVQSSSTNVHSSLPPANSESPTVSPTHSDDDTVQSSNATTLSSSIQTMLDEKQGNFHVESSTVAQQDTSSARSRFGRRHRNYLFPLLSTSMLVLLPFTAIILT